MKKLLMLDSSNLLYRHAQARAAGNVLLSFVNEVKGYVERFQPDVLVIGNDVGKSSYRSKLYPEYKGLRKEKAAKASNKVQERVKDVQPIREYLHKLFDGLAVYGGIRGVEMDDIASLLAPHYDMTIVTSDKDMLQIPAKIYSPMKRRIITPMEQLGVTREQITFYLSLVGDKVDNIKGLDGIGEGTAPYVINKYKSFEGLLKANPDDEKNHFVRRGMKALKDFDYKLVQDLVTTFVTTDKLTPAQLVEYQAIVEAINQFTIKWDWETSSEKQADFFEQMKVFGAEGCLDDIAMVMLG